MYLLCTKPIISSVARNRSSTLIKGLQLWPLSIRFPWAFFSFSLKQALHGVSVDFLGVWTVFLYFLLTFDTTSTEFATTFPEIVFQSFPRRVWLKFPAITTNFDVNDCTFWYYRIKIRRGMFCSQSFSHPLPSLKTGFLLILFLFRKIGCFVLFYISSEPVKCFEMNLNFWYLMRGLLHRRNQWFWLISQAVHFSMFNNYNQLLSKLTILINRLNQNWQSKNFSIWLAGTLFTTRKFLHVKSLLVQWINQYSKFRQLVIVILRLLSTWSSRKRFVQ